jgi:hypothetical protein
MTTEDDAFVALGPSPVGFFTYGANIDWGSFLIGHSWGVVTWGGGQVQRPAPPSRMAAVSGAYRTKVRAS